MKIDKVKLWGTILGVILFIILVAGFTYAYLLSRVETDLTTGSGKYMIDYSIVQDIESSTLSPSTSKEGGLHGKVRAKLSKGSVTSKLNLYITPSVIEGLNVNDALKYEVYVEGDDTFYEHGTFKDALNGSPIAVVENYSLTDDSNYTIFDIYIWLDNDSVTSSMVGKTFGASITADSVSVTGEF